jgi:hypothetical protein
MSNTSKEWAEELNFELQDLVNIVLGGVDTSDYPNFCDAFIDSATLPSGDGGVRDLTDMEINMINGNHPDFVNDCVFYEINIG